MSERLYQFSLAFPSSYDDNDDDGKSFLIENNVKIKTQGGGGGGRGYNNIITSDLISICAMSYESTPHTCKHM